MSKPKTPAGNAPLHTAKVYCPMCTHTVDAEIQRGETRSRLKSWVKAGQRCGHCSAPLDAGYIFPRAVPAARPVIVEL